MADKTITIGASGFLPYRNGLESNWIASYKQKYINGEAVGSKVLVDSTMVVDQAGDLTNAQYTKFTSYAIDGYYYGYVFHGFYTPSYAEDASGSGQDTYRTMGFIQKESGLTLTAKLLQRAPSKNIPECLIGSSSEIESSIQLDYKLYNGVITQSTSVFLQAYPKQVSIESVEGYPLMANGGTLTLIKKMPIGADKTDLNIQLSFPYQREESESITDFNIQVLNIENWILNADVGIQQDSPRNSLRIWSRAQVIGRGSMRIYVSLGLNGSTLGGGKSSLEDYRWGFYIRVEII